MMRILKNGIFRLLNNQYSNRKQKSKKILERFKDKTL